MSHCFHTTQTHPRRFTLKQEHFKVCLSLAISRSNASEVVLKAIRANGRQQIA